MTPKWPATPSCLVGRKDDPTTGHTIDRVQPGSLAQSYVRVLALVLASVLANAILISTSLAYAATSAVGVPSQTGGYVDWGGDGTGSLGDGTIPASTQYNYPTTPAVGTVISAADGTYTSEIVTTGGQVWASGDNTYGALGNGTTSTTATLTYSPVYTSSSNHTFTNAIAVSGGYYSSYALLANGTVWAWGNNGNGELGNGTTTQEDYPVEVVAGACTTCGSYLDDVVEIVAGSYYASALRADGTVWTWGYGGYESLGDGSTTQSTTPVEVCAVGNCTSPLTGVSQIAGREEAELALVNGNVDAWGLNSDGALGNGTSTGDTATTGSDLPVAVCAPGTSSGCSSYLSNIRSIGVSYQTGYVLSDAGNVYAWGANAYGELGQGTSCTIKGGGTECTTAADDVPNEVLAGADSPCGTYLCNVEHLAGGQFFALASTANGSLFAWGDNASGNLGNNTTTTETTPVQSLGIGGSGTLQNVTDVMAGSFSSMAFVTSTSSGVASSGGVASWGDNSVGELGNNTTTSSLDPIQTDGVPNVVAIASGSLFQVALSATGNVYTWGDNNDGQLGVGGIPESMSAVEVPSVSGTGYLSNIISVAAGSDFVVALSASGNVLTWGLNSSGQLGNGTTTQSNTPVEVCAPGTSAPCSTYLSHMVKIAADTNQAFAVTSSGNVDSWGNNTDGQLGNNTTTASAIPVEVVGVADSGYLGSIASVATGDFATYAVDTSGTMYSWGDNATGQLGINTTTESTTPVEVLGVGGTGNLTYVVAASGGTDFGYALDATGNVYSWGGNTSGDLGNGSTTQSKVPVEVCAVAACTSYLGDITSIGGSVGSYTALALQITGTGFGWGANAYGNSGDGSTTSYSYPVAIVSATGSGTLADIVELSAGSEMSQAMQAVTSFTSGTLSVTPPTSLALGTVAAGSVVGPVALGGLSWTDTLSDGSASSVTVAATDLYRSSTLYIPFTDIEIGAGQTITPGSGNTGSADTPGAAGPTALSGTVTTPGGFSNSVSLATGSTTSQGSYSQAANTLTLLVPANMDGPNAGTFTSIIEYTVTG